MTGADPILTLRQSFERLVQEPAGAVRPLTAEGFADARWVIADALEALRIGPRTSGSPPIFIETIFIHDDGGWRPETIPAGYTALEVSHLFLIAILERLGAHKCRTALEERRRYEEEFGPLGLERDLPTVVRFLDFVSEILQHDDLAVAGYKEPRDHDRSLGRIKPDWWGDHIKVDFAHGLLWKREQGAWRLLFSDIFVCRANYYDATWETSDLTPTVRPRLDLKVLVPMVAQRTPSANALLQGAAAPRGAVRDAVADMMKDPALSEGNKNSVDRVFRDLRLNS